MKQSYDQREYWQQRLAKNFDLRGVGYRRFSTRYNNWMYRLKRERLEEVLGGRDLARADVLDIGCGTGFFVQWYADRGARVHGIDITDVSIENLSRCFPACEFTVADIGGDDFRPPRSFDIVNMWDVIYHIVDDARFHRCLRNVAACAKPGALFLLTDNFGDSEDRRAAEHVRKRCLATYEAAMPALGFELAELRPLFFRLNREINRFDNLMAPWYYRKDKRETAPACDNLSLAVWKKR